MKKIEEEVQGQTIKSKTIENDEKSDSKQADIEEDKNSYGKVPQINQIPDPQLIKANTHEVGSKSPKF